jgi:HK97 family phage prohead protease
MTTMTEVELDQRERLAAMMAPKPEPGMYPSELASPATDNLIRKTLLTGDKPEARSLDGDAGTFEAVVSTWQTDRQNEAFAPGAFADTIQRWRQSGKQLPVLYAHDAANPSMLVGAIDPAAMYETSEGLHVKGRLDLQSRRGSEVYDLLRRGAPLGWSVGALILKANTVKDGARTLIRKVTELMEVSLTPTPANGGVRTIAIKGIELPGDDEASLPTRAEVEARLAEAGLLPGHPDTDAIRENARRHMAEVLTFSRNGYASKATATRTKSAGPFHVATFEC